MTFYSNQVQKLSAQLYPKADLTQQIIKAKQFIDTHYADNIDLDLIAAKAYLSKFHFLRLFKTFYGRTPNQYLVAVRINKAKELLKKNARLNEACLSIGFTSTTSFAGLFKKITGLTPGQYKIKAILKNTITKQNAIFEMK